MPIRPDLDALHVVDIENITTDPSGTSRHCARCGRAHADGSTWSVTYLAASGQPFTVILCGGCWTTTRERLERESFARADR